MRRVLVDYIDSEVTLAHDLVDPKGVALLRRGQRINAAVSGKLRNLGIAEVFVEDPALADLDLRPPLNPETVAAVSAELSQVMAEAAKALADRRPYTVSAGRLQALARAVVDDLTQHPTSRFEATPVISPDYLLPHLLNVAVLAVQLGRGAGLNRDRLLDLAAAGLTLDLGMLAVPDHVRRSSDPLSPEARSAVQRHTAQGVALLGPAISAFTKTVVMRHHERLDGSGYPQGLTETDIHPLVRIAAVADVYVALTHDRPHRRRLPAHEVVEYLMSAAGVHFDPGVVQHLLATVHPYPLGVRVRLSSGREGVVVAAGGLGTRPVVRVFREDGRDLDRPYELNLSDPQFQTEFISEILYT